MPTAYSILLCLPGKKTTDTDASFKNALLQLVRSKCGDVGASECYPAISRVTDLRGWLQRHVGTAAKPEVPPQELREALSKYLRCLASLVARFPILEGEGTCVPRFTWHDAFHPNRCTAQHSISLERAGFLFNLGTTTCHQALACDRSTPQGAKNASLLFQEAAGVFTSLQAGEAAKILAPQPDDMSPMCLAVLTKLMLVQAQQCEYRKAVLERVNHRETARLAEQLSVLYEELRRDFCDPKLSKIFDKCMVAYTTFKASLFHAEALAQIGKALHSEGAVGKAIPVLKQASSYLLGTKELAKSVSEAMAGSVAKIQDAVKKALALAKRDNTIAQQHVPASIEVDITLLGALLAQPILPSNIDVPDGEDDFLSQMGPPSKPIQYFECMTTLVGHTGEVRGVAISSDGDHIVTGSADGTVKVWGVPEELLATLCAHTDEVTSVAITPDCTICISGSRDKTAKVWDMKTGQLKANLTGHTAVVSCLAVTPDSSTCLVGSYDDTI
ncbi:BRO1-like domain-containing protein, partial [Dunaliella salina]